MYKAGLAFGNVLGFGAEVRNNTDFAGHDHLVFMPKAGVTIFGQYGLWYGYNVFMAPSNIFGIGHSQVSLNVNLNRRVIRESIVPNARPVKPGSTGTPMEG